MQRSYRQTRTKHRALQLLAEYFVLTPGQFARLLRNRTPSESDLRTAQRTLLLLFREGWLTRLPYLDLGRERGRATYVYGFKDATVKACGGKTLDEHSIRTLDHELAITELHMRARGSVANWKQDHLAEAKGIRPDAFFTVNSRPFFLEVERQGMGNYRDGVPSIIRKLNRYYDFYNTDECEKTWGFRQFRVLVTVESEARRETLLGALQNELQHRMFWIGLQNDLSSFRTPKGDMFTLEDLS